ncbi:hypothetical protein RHGRI_023225 [Rhododendron griersonianum]|uniref:SWIM-type domain-containing protein n=1 Tax=Rhododendron griersonianum TaxID=479676 RepID=A0AAV6J539_9ERIC|nr:hypothetical protein RHGRI_023225 [Rhododendron griersonianum]
MEIEISGSSSPISCEVLGIDDNYARDDCQSRRKLEFKDDDDFFNTDVPIEEEGEQDVLHNSLDATSNINLLHSQIPHEAIPKLDMKFKTEEAAFEFYNAYAYKVGFSVRRSKEYKDKSGMLVTRIFCCSCEGKRGKDKRDSIVKSHRPETRFGCLARKKIKYCRQTKQYDIVEFNPVHNHAVCTPSKTHLHKSHRKLSVAQAAELDMANDCGIGPKATVEFMARQAGGRENLGLVDDRRYEELKADFRATQSTPSLSFPVEMLKHAASMYTPDVFVLFQRELSKAHDCNLKKFGESGTVTEYDVSPYGKDDQHHLVTYDSSADMVLCSCKKFEFAGLLCSHALKVLCHNNVMRIPEKYILKRWTKNAKSGSTGTCAWTSLIEDPKAMMGRRYKELCHLCTQLATRAAETEEAYNIALDCLKKIAEEVDASLTGESFDGTSNANNSASLENKATLGEGIEKRVKGLKVKERATGRSSKRPRNALERAIKSKRTPVNNLNSMDNPIQQSELHPIQQSELHPPLSFSQVLV